MEGRARLECLECLRFLCAGRSCELVTACNHFLFVYSCTFPMQSHESQVSAIVAQLGGAVSTDSSGAVGNVGHLARYRGRAWSSCVVLAMLELQILKRLSESIHLSHYNPLAQMHVLGYLIGLGFYPTTSFTLFSQHFEVDKPVSGCSVATNSDNKQALVDLPHPHSVLYHFSILDIWNIPN